MALSIKGILILLLIADFGTGVKENLFLNNYFEEVYSQNGKNSFWCSTCSYAGSPSSHFVKYVDKLTDLALNTGHNTREKKQFSHLDIHDAYWMKRFIIWGS